MPADLSRRSFMASAVAILTSCSRSAPWVSRALEPAAPRRCSTNANVSWGECRVEIPSSTSQAKRNRSQEVLGRAAARVGSSNQKLSLL